MKSKYQNGLFIFGVVVLVIMVTQLNFTDVWNGLTHAGYWFFAIVALWAVLYMFNTAAWYPTIQSSEPVHPPQEPTSGDDNTARRPEGEVDFQWLYKIIVSGFALNYATPGGLMGGEPYRIMELSSRTGAERVSSSAILYVMTHIFTHFCFWAVCIVLYLLTQPMSVKMGLLLAAVAVSCGLGIWFFLAGYQKGLAVRMINVLRYIPFVKKWTQPFAEKHRQQLDIVDGRTAALHQQNPKTFLPAIALEMVCRFSSVLEVMFILMVPMPHVDYLHRVLVLAFTSLFANLLFFMPLQLDGREGGFLVSISALGTTASAGTFAALPVRLRELVWTSIGLLFIKINERKDQDQAKATP